jgi:Ala-tRNA(Pro) deacylase
MTVPARLKSLLEESEVPYAVSSHRPTYTAQEEAAVLHVPGREVAKTVVLRAGDELVLGVLPAPYRVNFRKLEGILGVPVRLASEQEFIGLFPDCELGAAPPFGALYSLRVLVDESLTSEEEIIFTAGTHRESLRMRFRDFSRLARPQICSFAEENLRAIKSEGSLQDLASTLEKQQIAPLWALNIAELTGHNIEARGREEVNRMLGEGWKLLHMYTLRYEEDGVWRERPMVILGRPAI